MIKAKISDIINSQNVLKELSEKPVRVRTSFAIARIIRQVENEMQTFEKARAELINRYGVKDENGNPKIENGQIPIVLELVDKYNSEVKELLDTYINLEVEPLKIEDLDEIQLTPAQAYAIECFIENPLK